MNETASPRLVHRTVHGMCALALALATFAAPVAAAPGKGDASPSAPTVNVNTASVDELQVLPGIGESRARAIVERRRTKGAFDSVEQLAEIRGIGPAMVERLRPLVKLRGGAGAAAARNARSR